MEPAVADSSKDSVPPTAVADEVDKTTLEDPKHEIVEGIPEKEVSQECSKGTEGEGKEVETGGVAGFKGEEKEKEELEKGQTGDLQADFEAPVATSE